MASSSAAVAGRLAATAFSVWSLKMRNAGIPRRLASAKRHCRNLSSTLESGASLGLSAGRGGAGVGTADGLRERRASDEAAVFLFQRLAVRRQARLAVGDGLAVLFEYGVGQAEKIGPRHGAEDLFELVSRHL